MPDTVGKGQAQRSADKHPRSTARRISLPPMRALRAPARPSAMRTATNVTGTRSVAGGSRMASNGSKASSSSPVPKGEGPGSPNGLPSLQVERKNSAQPFSLEGPISGYFIFRLAGLAGAIAGSGFGVQKSGLAYYALCRTAQARIDPRIGVLLVPDASLRESLPHLAHVRVCQGLPKGRRRFLVPFGERAQRMHDQDRWHGSARANVISDPVNIPIRALNYLERRLNILANLSSQPGFSS